MTINVITDAWNKLDIAGWSMGHVHLANLYPMPGDDDFEDDERFLNLPIFRTKFHQITYVRDDLWHFPLEWHRQYETRPDSARRLKFILRDHGRPGEEVRAAILAVRRAMYLEIFKSGRPLGLSTLRKRLRIYLKIASAALRIGKRIREFTVKELHGVVQGLDKASRKSLVSVYKVLRWWKGLSGSNYSMFDPPPPLEAFDGTPQEWRDESDDAAAASTFYGLDADNIRTDDEAEEVEDEEGTTYQPLPDEFVGMMGAFCLHLLIEVAPEVDDCLVAVLCLPTHRQRLEGKRIVEDWGWPPGFEVTSVRGLRSLAYLCQAALIFLLSLILGCRWSEISALPITALHSRGEGSEKTYRLVGPVHKGEQATAGIIRDWPLAPQFAGFVERQVRYVESMEGPNFKFLWRSHKKIWKSAAPLKAASPSLNALIRVAGFDPLLEGTSFHHHRFRKTTARLIVVALHGGPTILRRLFGHETLTITLRYILVNDSLIDEMREMAAEEERRVAARHLEQRESLRGGGADKFRASVDALIGMLNISVPSGKRDQATIGIEDVLDVLEADGSSFALKQIVPGLVLCGVTGGHQGLCASKNEPPNVARCDSRCQWHLVGDGYLPQARINVRNALEHMAKGAPGSFAWRYFADVVRGRTRDFPELLDEFGENGIFRRILEEENVGC